MAASLETETETERGTVFCKLQQDPDIRKKRKFGAYAMKRVASGAHLPTPWLLSLSYAQTIEPTTAWADITNPDIRKPI